MGRGGAEGAFVVWKEGVESRPAVSVVCSLRWIPEVCRTPGNSPGWAQSSMGGARNVYADIGSAQMFMLMLGQSVNFYSRLTWDKL